MKNCFFFLTQISILTITLLGKDFIKSFFLVVTINETNPFLNLQKAIVGGIVAAVIVTGDKVTDTECAIGYVKVDNVCVDMCEGINCGIGGECLSGNCTCQTGYENIDNFCEDMCEGINCGIGGDCLSGNCTCQTGYTNVENVCEETCELTPCKELINFEQNMGILINKSHQMNPDLITPLVVMLSLFSLSRRSR